MTSTDGPGPISGLKGPHVYTKLGTANENLAITAGIAQMARRWTGEEPTYHRAPCDNLAHDGHWNDISISHLGSKQAIA